MLRKINLTVSTKTLQFERGVSKGLFLIKLDVGTLVLFRIYFNFQSNFIHCGKPSLKFPHAFPLVLHLDQHSRNCILQVRIFFNYNISRSFHATNFCNRCIKLVSCSRTYTTVSFQTITKICTICTITIITKYIFYPSLSQTCGYVRRWNVRPSNTIFPTKKQRT